MHKKSPMSSQTWEIFGAGYGSRTRLHGLGSRCITDIRILQLWLYYSKAVLKKQGAFVAQSDDLP